MKKVEAIAGVAVKKALRKRVSLPAKSANLIPEAAIKFAEKEEKFLPIDIKE